MFALMWTKNYFSRGKYIGRADIYVHKRENNCDDDCILDKIDNAPAVGE